MSKASAWAQRFADAPKDLAKGVKLECPSLNLGGQAASVTEAGDLQVEGGRRHWVILEPPEALRLARWILDTFGDAAPSSVGRAP